MWDDLDHIGWIVLITHFCSWGRQWLLNLSASNYSTLFLSLNLGIGLTVPRIFKQNCHFISEVGDSGEQAALESHLWPVCIFFILLKNCFFICWRFRIFEKRLLLLMAITILIIFLNIRPIWWLGILNCLVVHHRLL